MSFKIFETQNWHREHTYNFYKSFDDPFFNVTVNLDVTECINGTRHSGGSFFLSCLYYALVAANSIEEFRLRIHNDELRIYDIIHGGSTILFDNHSFGFAYYDFFASRKIFVSKANDRITTLKDKPSFDPSNEKSDLIYFSSLPWLSFTSVKHAQDKRINASIPRISFGKYFNSAQKTLMPVNIEVHHALLDGYHIGMFVSKFQQLLHENKD